MIVAIIPARKSSKRLKNKNVLSLCGKPLIEWTIDAASASQSINKIIISSDIDKVLELSARKGLGSFTLRPSNLSQDHTSTREVILHELRKNKLNDGTLVILQPTSPLRDSKHIDAAINQYVQSQAIGVVSVCECEHPPVWSNTLPDDLSMFDFIKPENNIRSQELKTFYRLNGAIFVYDIKSYITDVNILNNAKTYAYVMDKNSSVDIDTSLDFDLAELILRRRAKKFT